ncbi:hypothetical protein [Robbsia andropogonis]|uniref:hypothetical protein n=1 Tax=Robbsia andropogonis TaxID=28092 RepID=UPI0012F9D2C6|nr:hypothetical protein [Robbsia andropogonis]MCP1118705.1 hypothetical protein [Robbsia andropogonis]MCP1128172.1 hypothetical protein [Robbsia andropogonis]
MTSDPWRNCRTHLIAEAVTFSDFPEPIIDGFPKNRKKSGIYALNVRCDKGLARFVKYHNVCSNSAAPLGNAVFWDNAPMARSIQWQRPKRSGNRGTIRTRGGLSAY